MSTRCTIHFCYLDDPKPDAIIYRHTDGYPEEAGADLIRFLREVKRDLRDTRFGDASYLAAKFVVWQAAKLRASLREALQGLQCAPGESPLDFLSLGICSRDPGDIQYRYRVHCGAEGPEGLPVVECFTARGSKPCEIPWPDPEEAQG